MMHILLSNLTTSESSVTASALINIWVLKNNGSKPDAHGPIRDEVAEDWELSFVSAANQHRGCPEKEAGCDWLPSGVEVVSLAERSFEDEISGAVDSNYQLLFIGMGLIFFHVAMVLGKFNLVEQRVIDMPFVYCF